MDQDALFDSRVTDAGRRAIDFPEGWKQGRGLFGGLVIGALVRAAEEHVGTPERRVRSVTAELAGPASPGPGEIAVRVIRAGNAVTTVAAELLQEGGAVAHAVVVLGAPRPVDLSFVEATPPEAPPWRSLEPLPPDIPFVPEFAKNYEFRNVGPAPFSSHAEALAVGWIRPRKCSRRSAAYLVGQADAWWPSFFSRMREPRPIGTIAFSMQVGRDLPDDDAPLLHRGRTIVAQGGYAVELRELWSERGDLVASNQQTFAIIK
jgi:acyl-CoA thioesterase